MTKRVFVVSSLLAFLVCGVLAQRASAQASIVAVGWWSQRPGAAAIEGDGFELALAPNGPTSAAALRIRVDAPELLGAILELTESGGVGAEVAAVDVCPSSNSWDTANPGAWDARPAWDCDSKKIPLSRRATGEWAGDISELLARGTRSVALVPTSHADTQGLPVPFQLTFSGAALSPEVPADDEPGPSPTTFEDITPPGVVEPDDAPPQPAPRADDDPVVPPADDTPAVDDSPPDVAADDEFDSAASDTDDPGAPKPWWRLVILVPVAGAFGALTVFARRTASERGWGG